MTLVDSSVWIDFTNGNATPQTSTLIELLNAGKALVGDLILAEVFQGFRTDRQVRDAEALFALIPTVEILGVQAAYTSAQRYRALRRRGVTVRKTADALIASYCITTGLPLLYSDRDFDPYVEHAGLVAA